MTKKAGIHRTRVNELLIGIQSELNDKDVNINMDEQTQEVNISHCSYSTKVKIVRLLEGHFKVNFI